MVYTDDQDNSSIELDSDNNVRRRKNNVTFVDQEKNSQVVRSLSTRWRSTLKSQIRNRMIRDQQLDRSLEKWKKIIIKPDTELACGEICRPFVIMQPFYKKFD